MQRRSPRKVNLSPSGSRNAPDTSTVTAASSTPIVSGASVPTGSGGRFAGELTVTANVCDALRPSGSVAVTVSVAVPSATGTTVTVLSETDTAATDGAEELAP